MSDLEIAARFAYAILGQMRCPDELQREVRDKAHICLGKALNHKTGDSQEEIDVAWRTALVVTGQFTSGD